MSRSSFKRTFRVRVPEWILSATMFLWGIIALTSRNLFVTEPSFTPMLSIMSQTHWGIFLLFIGMTRLAFLIINGAWRPSAHIRAVGCIFGTIFWSIRLVATLSLTAFTPVTAVYMAFIAFDVFSLWFAAGDAKLADLSARGEVNLR